MPDEKFDEKEMEKRDEKAPDEKWRRDQVSTIVWAVIIIWAGVVFLADSLGILAGLREVNFGVPGLILGGLQAWALIFLGAGIIILLEVVFRLSSPTYRRPVGGSLILGVILVGIGLGDLFGGNIIWPLILIGLGLIVLLRGAFRGPKRE